MQIFLACAFGALIGGILAIQLAKFFWPLWILSAVSGGFVAYLSINLQEVIQACVFAWRKTVSWRPNKDKIGLVVLSFLAGISSAITVGLWFFSCVLLCVVSSSLNTYEWVANSVILVILLIGSIIIGMLFAFFSSFESIETLRESRPKFQSVLKTCNPMNGFFLVLLKAAILTIKYSPIILWFVIKNIPKTIVAIGQSLVVGSVTIAKIARLVFITIHTELRLLCLCDAAFGAIVGFFTGNVLLGAIVGGLLGVLNFELISVRLLHLSFSIIKR